MRLVVEKPKSQQLWGMEELEEQETTCGWASLGVAVVEVGRDVSGSVILREVRGHERSWIWKIAVAWVVRPEVMKWV
jgi:hypothetical protein